MTPHDVVIVGTGPAGMFAAKELLDSEKGLRILLIDKGLSLEERKCEMIERGRCASCKPCNIMCGVGGSGTFSDGTLNLRPDIGGNLAELVGEERTAWELVRRVDETFLEFGTPKELYGTDDEELKELKRRAASAGVRFVEIPQRHIGTDKAPHVIKRFEEYLKSKGAEFITKTEVVDLVVRDSKCEGVVTKDGKTFEAKVTILAPGRVGAHWLDNLCEKYGIRTEFAPIDVGVRVEVPSIIMDPVMKVCHDPKFHIRTRSYDDFVRTYCTNHRGFVVKEKYDKDMIGVNGHSFKERETENTNFALLVRIALTKPVENTIRYGQSIAKLATTIGGGKPILQRLGDLRRGRRSNEKSIASNPVQPTLNDTTPGDISMALPHRIVVDILEALEKLSEVIPGVASDSTLLYAPEIKFYATRVEVNSWMETSLRNLFVAGDGAGLSRDLVNAAATGILAAQGALRRLRASA